MKDIRKIVFFYFYFFFYFYLWPHLWINQLESWSAPDPRRRGHQYVMLYQIDRATGRPPVCTAVCTYCQSDCSVLMLWFDFKMRYGRLSDGELTNNKETCGLPTSWLFWSTVCLIVQNKRNIPADILRNDDVVVTSKRRQWCRFDVITTSLLRHVFSGLYSYTLQSQPLGVSLVVPDGLGPICCQISAVVMVA